MSNTSSDLEKAADDLPNPSPDEVPEKNDEHSKNNDDTEKQDPNLITFDGPTDPLNPKNWPLRSKWAAVGITSCFTLISPIASSMVAPALSQIKSDLHIPNEILSQMVLSIFLLGYAVGPLFLGPLSEMYGRVPVLQLANLVFLIFNLVCGFAQNTAEMLVFRFISGLGGSAPLSIGGGVLADCFVPEERGLAVAIYSLGPLIGPALGPIAGGWIAETISWRWVFWIISMADAAIQVLGLLFLRETYSPVLLARKAASLRKETGNEALYVEKKDSHLTPAKRWKQNLSRPFILLFTQPIIIAMAIYSALIYGTLYLVVSTFSSLYTDDYGESVGIAGLHYIAQAIGLIIGAQSTARFTDWVYAKFKERNNGVGKPEFRIITLIPGAVLVPVGIFWYGWSAQAHLFWIMPDIGVAIFSCATIIAVKAVQTYILDAYTRYAASAMAAVTTLRSLAGFGFPLFALAMYNALGYGWGNSILAFVAIVIGLPAPFVFWRYGERLRGMSRFAAGD